jgi:predicted dehydrogenase
VRVGIIGVGRMGRRHIKNVTDLGLELVGICDQSPESLASAAREYDIPREQQFSDAANFLRLLQPDCVVVATTAPSHCSLTMLAAETGVKYILCEKPMASSLEECDAMIESTESRGVKLAIDHQMRFLETVATAKRIVNSEDLGGLTSMTMVTGNIGLAMNGTHYFELFRLLTGEAPHEVTAWFSKESFPNPRGPQYEDHAGAVRLTTASGKRFYLEAGVDQGHGVTLIYGARYGQIILDELTGVMHLSWRKQEERSFATTRYGCTAVQQTRIRSCQDGLSGHRALLHALLNGGDFPTGCEAKLTIQVLVAAYLSNENGHVPSRLEKSALPRDRKFCWA